MCKSPLHGPRNYVDQTCERSANLHSACTFSCYRAKPKCNFTVRPLYDRSTMLGRLLQTVWVWFFWRRNESEILFGNSVKCLRQWSEWNFWRAINSQCVSIQQMIRDFWFGAMARKGACTVIGWSFARLADIIAWPVQRRFAHRGKFQNLFNDQGEIISNLGYSTSFPCNQKQQCRNRVH